MLKAFVEWAPVSAPLLVLARLASAWHRLPPRVTVRLDLAGRPAAWMDRETFATVIVAAMMGIFVVVPLLARRVGGPIRQIYVATAWGAAAGAVAVLWQLVDLNLGHVRLRFSWVAAAALTAAFLGAVLARLAYHAPAGPQVAVAALEKVGTVTSRSPSAAIVGLAFCLIPVVCLLLIPASGWRYLLVTGLVIGLWGSLMPLVGFRYDFTRRGVSITGLWPLKYHVAKEQITGWEISGRPPGVCGVGLRMARGGRAYVWGRGQGLTIKTTSGFLHLGGDAERMSRYMSAVMRDRP